MSLVQGDVDRVVLSYEQAKMRPQRRPHTLERVARIGDGDADGGDGARDAAIHQRQQQLFLAREAIVQTAGEDSGGGSDFSNSRRGEAFLAEQAAGRLEHGVGLLQRRYLRFGHATKL